MRMRLNETEKRRSLSCDCLHNNIVLESLVVVLTLVSVLAVTGENLISFNLITVPRYSRAGPDVSSTSSNETKDGVSALITENSNVMDILLKVFHYTSLGIAGVFFLEISLKLCTIRKKCFTNPWQIFDAVVIVTTLTLELVFHFVFFSERALSSLTYIVILRLWRLPMVCSIRANEVQEASDCDNELYRSGRLKAEEKCRLLETTILQQAETIRKLERLLHNMTSSKQNDFHLSSRERRGVVVGDGDVVTNAVSYDYHAIKNGTLLNKTPDITDAFSTQYDLPTSCTSERSSHSNLLSNAQKQSKNIPHNEMETQFIITHEAEIPTSLYKLHPQTSDEMPLKGTIKEEAKNLCDTKTRATGCSSKTVDSSESSSDCVDGTSKTTTQSQIQPCSETFNTSHVPSSQETQIFLRQRKRRSSASEILDYNSMNSSDMDTVFYENDKTSSCQSLEHQKLFSNDEHETNFHNQKIKNNNNIPDHDSDKSVSSTTVSRDKFISMASEEKKNLQDRKRTRRFASCPEYVYTQRMNISNDESMLIEDGHATDDLMVYNNLGFDFEENTLLQVVAEYDGTTTYRNEDGIPITSL